MATTVFDIGLDELRTFTTSTFGVLLVDNTYVVDRADSFVADVVSAELGGVGYGRVALAGKSRTVDNTNHRTVYDCTDPDFGNIAIGETAEAMVLYKLVTNDADSLLIAYYPLGGVPTTGSAFVVNLNPIDGLIFTRQRP